MTGAGWRPSLADCLRCSALFPPHPCLPRRPFSTSHHSVCSPPSRRHSIPTAISTICAVTRQLLSLRNKSYGAAFPLIAPPRSSSVHLSVTLIILPFAPFFWAAFLIPCVWTRRCDLGSLQPAVLSGHGCKAPGRRLESLCHSLQWNCMSEIHLNHVHVPYMLPATCPDHNSSFIPF